MATIAVIAHSPATNFHSSTTSKPNIIPYITTIWLAYNGHNSYFKPHLAVIVVLASHTSSHNNPFITAMLVAQHGHNSCNSTHERRRAPLDLTS